METHVFSINLGFSIRELRQSSGLSSSGLAELSGLSKTEISQIESGKKTPRIETLWSIATALNEPLGRLLTAEGERTKSRLEAGDRTIEVELIGRSDTPCPTDVFKMDFQPKARREASGHGWGVKETVFVISGKLWVGDQARPQLVQAGQSCSFSADVPHLYCAEGEPVSAVVTLEYPALVLASDVNTTTLPSPLDDEDWKGIEAVLKRQRLEVAHGTAALHLRISATDLADATALEERLQEIIGQDIGEFHDPALTCLVTDARFVSAFTFRHPVAPLSQCAGTVGEPETITRTDRLESLAGSISPLLTDREPEPLEKVVVNSPVLISTLAAEALTRSGQATVPRQVSAPGPIRTVNGSMPSDSDPLFEDRIDVHAYNAFELVHPAYARQAVWMARFIERHGGRGPLEILDMGTGPGLPLQMLLEIKPELRVKAIEPSPTAFSYLQHNLGADERVELIQEDFLSIAEDKSYDVVTSAGASHHLNTAHFFQKAQRLLKSGGHLIISDEFISAFETRAERNVNLLRHHLTYIVGTLISIKSQDLEPAARDYVMAIRSEAPRALFEARTGDIGSASCRCRRLFKTLRAIEPPASDSHPLIAFYRFHYLELEALVAGLDYEVERKTFPDNFALLAAMAEFEEIDHCRLYPTDGSHRRGGGTHVFAFRRRN